ncbi:MAG: DUF4416 family protein [Candidatus Eisenbacteria bacterium]
MPIVPSRPVKVKLIAAVMAADPRLLSEARDVFARDYGVADASSTVFPFSYSDFYREEMGEALVKVFCSFERLVEPGEIVRAKLRAIESEKRFLAEGTSKRRVNLDPGYLDGTKLVLATTKNSDHRIYVGEGLYAGVELVYRKGSFIRLDWTYLDYRESLATEFFNGVRRIYLAQLKAEANC